MNTGLNIYAALTASYFFNLQFKTFLIIYISVTVISIFSEVYQSAKRKRERESNSLDT